LSFELFLLGWTEQKNVYSFLPSCYFGLLFTYLVALHCVFLTRQNFRSIYLVLLLYSLYLSACEYKTFDIHESTFFRKNSYEFSGAPLHPLAGYDMWSIE